MIHMRAGQVTHLRRQHRPDQRAGAGDRREVVAEEHTPVHRHVVLAVLVVLGGRRAPVVRLCDALLDVGRVEAVGDEVGADGGEDEPDRVDRLAADQGDHHPRQAAEQRDADPRRRSAAVSTAPAARRGPPGRRRAAVGPDRPRGRPARRRACRRPTVGHRALPGRSATAIRARSSRRWVVNRRARPGPVLSAWALPPAVPQRPRRSSNR